MLRYSFIAIALAASFGCSRSHGADPARDDAPTADASVEVCPDFSCEPRCVGVSVCNCLAPGGEADCRARGGECIGERCELPDAGPSGIDGGPDDAGRGEVDVAERGARCGAERCAAEAELCLACAHADADGAEVRHAHCVAVADGPNPFGAWGEHGCGFPSVLAVCDGPEDCADGERCTFSGGEFGYAQCWPADEAFGELACHTDADCEDGVRCGEVDPLGYFSPLHEELGWRPFACGGATSGASTFCDRFEGVCAYGGETGVYDRGSCLRAFDGFDADEQTCAGQLLAEAEAGVADRCVTALGASPCTP